MLISHTLIERGNPQFITCNLLLVIYNKPMLVNNDKSLDCLTKNIAIYIKSCRKKMNITQANLVNCLNIKSRMLHVHEGDAKSMKLSTFLMICDCLGRDPAEFLKKAIGNYVK